MRTQSAGRSAGVIARALALGMLSGSAVVQISVAGDDHAGPYERMAPLDAYLMDSDAEMALARSAAPPAISGKATIMTLQRQGYKTAVSGSNGFTCLVERAWMSPFGSAEFWNPKIRGPVCYNPAASKSGLAYTVRRTQLVLAGRTKEQMLEELRAALARKEIPDPAPGAMSFMMSKDGYLGDGNGHWHSHLMFYIPKVSPASWGANVAGSPVVLDDREVPEPDTMFLVPVARWSDGTASSTH